MTDHPSVPPGSLLGGKFRIRRLLGAGAMGTVYAVDHELTRHTRALKLLHPAVQNIPDIVRRFLNEASAAGRAGNPHLVETFDAGTLPTGEPYVVMELLEGETLGAVLHRDHALEPSLAAELVAQAAEGIEAAHKAGIIHRDLKPENLFVTARDDAPFVKIMDFGVSKFATGSSGGLRGTRAGMVYGSPAYMSPEQLAGETSVDGRTDVFALGVVLFECLTGSLPFDAPTIELLMVKILTGERRSLDSLRPGLPPALADVVNRALATRRDERIPSARALVEALSPFRALPGRRPSGATTTDVGFAATVALTPATLVSGAPSDPIPLPPGVARSGRGFFWATGAAAMAVAVAVALLLARPSPTANANPTATATTTTNATATAPSIAPEPTTLATAILPAAPLPSPTDDSSVAPATPRRASTSTVRPSSSASATPSSSPPSRSSASQDLGLRVDNPFR